LVALDGALVLGYLIAVSAALYFFEVGGLARTVLGLPLVLFLPGYVLVAAAFPTTSSSAADDDRSQIKLVATGNPGWYERLALSVGISLGVLPILGLIVASTRWGFTTTTVLVSLAGFTGAGMVLAVARRARLSDSRRFQVPVRTASGDVYRGLFAPDTRFDGALNVVLILSIVVALSAVGYALVAPQGGASTNEYQILTENESGNLVTSGYPDAIPPGESEEMIVSVTNGADEQQTYTVVVEVQSVEESDDELTVLEEVEQDRLELTAQSGATTRQRHTVAPTITGETLRINYYFYRGDAPEDAGPESADEHLWVTVDGTAG
jgi:uncharacterized membrane protein